MTCPFCGAAFGEQEALATCGACLLKRLKGVCAQGLMRCPYCGYESLLPPKWLRKREHGTGQ